MSFSIYVAASSHEIDRAEQCMAALRKAGVIVTSLWPTTIRDVGDANPRDASLGQRYEWADADIAQVNSAAGFLLLMPQKASMGAAFEFGFAFASEKVTWVSGPNQSASIFTALAHYHYDTDEAAIESVVNFAATVENGFGALEERINQARR
jgi:nucleoside 2-deoxyribosyltransferase